MVNLIIRVGLLLGSIWVIVYTAQFLRKRLKAYFHKLKVARIYHKAGELTSEESAFLLREAIRTTPPAKL